jgi:hypothetical protein
MPPKKALGAVTCHNQQRPKWWDEYIPIINKLEKLVEAASDTDLTDVERSAEERKREAAEAEGAAA